MATREDETMTKLMKTALVLISIAGMTGCAITPPSFAYVGPRIEVVRPAPYYVQPSPYYAPYYDPSPYYRHYGYGHGRW